MKAQRTALFMAINNPRFIQGARRFNCDAITLDLEDAVAEPQKAHARTLPRDTYPVVSVAGATVQIRINHMPWWADLEGVVWPGLTAINYPKAESAEEVRRVDAKISELERRHGIRPGSIELHAAIETARGVVHAYEIASTSSRIRSFGGGGAGLDVCRDLVIEAAPGLRRVLDPYIIGECELVAKVLGLRPTSAVQSVSRVMGDVVSGDTAFDEAAANRKAGFYGGGLCLHPNRVDGLNRGYTPPPEEVQRARQVIDLFDELGARREVEGEFNGKLVDQWEAERARKLLAWAEACERREREKASARARSSVADEKPEPPAGQSLAMLAPHRTVEETKCLTSSARFMVSSSAALSSSFQP